MLGDAKGWDSSIPCPNFLHFPRAANQGVDRIKTTAADVGIRGSKGILVENATDFFVFQV